MLGKLVFPETEKLITALGKDNIRFVGGCVRDLLVGLPIHDIDFATVFTPEQVIYHCQKANIHVVPTGIAHGTVTAVIRSWEFEITSLRRDVKTDGRHASVEFVDDWEEDAKRRDFTINAFYLGIDGTLTDYFGGMDHLKSGHIHFIGDAEQRIKEDFLRILRYFRFLGRFGKGSPPDDKLERLFARYSAQINHLSGERIQSEMFKILALPDAASILEYMQNCGVTHFIFPGDVDFSVLKNLQKIEAENNARPDIIRRLAAIDGYNFDELIQHWKLSNQHKKHLRALISDVSLDNPKVVMRHLGRDLMIDLAYLEAARGYLKQPLADVMDFANTWKIPKFPIMGSDVMQMGMKEGQQIGRILTDLENYWEQRGYLLSREELLKRLKVLVNEAQAS